MLCPMAMWMNTTFLFSWDASKADSTRPDRAVTILVYGDVVVGKALELLLPADLYRVRFAAPHSLGFPEERARLLAGVRLLLLTPGMGATHRDKILAILGGGAASANIPVLELGAPPAGARIEADYSVPWPCRIEDLSKQIDAALRFRADRAIVDSLRNTSENTEGRGE